MKKLVYLLLLSSSLGYSQTITIDSNTYSATELVNLLFNNSCIESTNISYSSNQAVAYFNKNNSAFPIEEGIIIRNGIAQYTQGSYTGTNLSSQLNTNSDADLQNLSNSSGQNSTISDVAFLQFDFIPISSDFSFNFLFASNEYGEFQCGFSDAFAFLITDLNTGTTTNIALVPNTNTPVSVKNIRDNTYNSSCISVNPELFDVYNVNNPGASSLNMRGYTVVLNASTTIIPNNPYRIRLVIGDYNDPDYDSAIFISAGSFSNSINLGEDAIICDGSNTTITTSLDDTFYAHSWTLNDVIIPNETSNTLTITEAGTYEVTVIKNGTLCEIKDEIVFTELQTESPINLVLCEDGSSSYTYDLTQNDATTLGLTDSQYQLFYYNSPANILANNPIPTSNLNAYSSTGNETIYIKLFDTNSNTFCNAELIFDLIVTENVIAGIPDDILLCNTTNDLSANLLVQNFQVLNGLIASQYTIQYFATEADAISNTNPIPYTFDISIGTSPQTVWVRIHNNFNVDCYDVTNFDVIVNPLPEVDSVDNIIACENFSLPPLTNGNYYDGANGTGTLLNPNDIIDQTGVYYIFSGPDENGCTNETSFQATFMQNYEIDSDYCGVFIVPSPLAGNFYTQPGGPNGSGVLLPSGTEITTDQTVYFYVEIDGVFCTEKEFPITINPLPLIDEPEDVITCDSYTLPALTNGDYFTESGGLGLQLYAGDMITVSDTLYVYTYNGFCASQSDFEITIINSPPPIVRCGSYTLPDLPAGNYYTQINGQGSIIPVGTTYTASQTIYVYAETTTTPNCTSDYILPITIKPLPIVDDLDDVIRCKNNPYILPTLSNGNYFTGNMGSGTALFAGDVISSTKTIYIFDTLNGCANQSIFHVEIIELPLVENFTDIFTCEPFELPTITNGNYYTESGGNGTMLPAGTIIDTTQSIYIYNQNNDANACYAESVFQVNILTIEVEQFDDVTACDSFTLEPLAVGDYYRLPNGEDLIDPSEYTITTLGTQTIYIYAENGDRFICSDESSFQLTISSTPTLQVFQDIIKCGSYILPQLDNSNYTVNYYLEPNATSIIDPSNYEFNQAGVYTVYVYATAFNNTNCFDETSFQLTIYPLLDLSIYDAIMCVDPITNDVINPAFFNTNLNPNLFTVNWYLNNMLVNTGPSYSATQVGTYTIETIKLTPDVGSNCNYNIRTVEVTRSSFAVAQVEVTDDFENTAIATVNITNGYGVYEYQLDDGNFQASNQFFNVSSGEHTITIKDTYGNCGINSVTFVVLKYPHFFTPNGDGYNDTWNIWDLSSQKTAYVYIFDRYGKFLNQFKTNSNGWDGKLNGRDLPSTDYWFVVKYLGKNNEENTFKAHFAMKR